MEKNIEQSILFAYGAIEDARDTIRAIDQKVNFLFFGLAIPLSGLSKIFDTVRRFLDLPFRTNQWSFQMPLTIVFFLAWISAFYLSLKILASPEKPVRHINNDGDASGVFFSGTLFKKNPLDLFLYRKSLKANLTLVQNVKRFKISEGKILEELVFEHMKLVYLRDLKRFRQIWAYKLFFVWACLGCLIWSLTLFY